MNFDDKKDRIRFLKYVIILAVTSIIIGSWISTQMIASDCGYSPLLGGCIHIGDIGIYLPYKYFIWAHDKELSLAIPDIIDSAGKWPMITGGLSLLGTVVYIKSNSRMTSHGTASFATKKEIEDSIIGPWEDDKKKKRKRSGVAVGRNPFTHELLLDNSPTHILVTAPTRSGKGVGPVLSTGITWRNSIFFFDPKGEIWQHTAGYRKNRLHQKVIKFQPLCADGSGARWNALAEIDFRTPTETKDLDIIVGMLANPTGEEKKDFWYNSNLTVFKGVILHLLYKHYREGKNIPTISDIIAFLTTPGKTHKERFEEMAEFAHITPEEYLQTPNVFEINYPKDYILDFRDFEESLGFILKETLNLPDNEEFVIKDQKELKKYILMAWENKDTRSMIDFDLQPYKRLLTHPTVIECAEDMISVADSEQTMASIMKGALACINIYQNPLVQTNTCQSDFRLVDLMNPEQAVSVYYVMEPNDIEYLRPLSRLFVSTLLGKLQRDMDARIKKKQRLLLLLDEFPRLGKMTEIEAALPICAGYGIKICIIIQNVGQLTKFYTKENEILSNCQVQVYFSPDKDTAEELEKNFGEKTIKSVSHSDGGGLFKGSNSTSEQGRKLMTVDEIMRLPKDKSFIIIKGEHPFLVDKIFYFKIPYLKSRLDDWKKETEVPGYKAKYPLIEISDFGTILDGYDKLIKANQEMLENLIKKRNENAAIKKERSGQDEEETNNAVKEETDSNKAEKAETIDTWNESEEEIEKDSFDDEMEFLKVISSGNEDEKVREFIKAQGE